MKIKQIAIILTLIAIVIFITFYVKQLQTSTALTKEQMIAQVETVYNGAVQSFVERDGYNLASFEKNGSTYEVKINAHNGELSNMQAIFITDKPIVAVKDDTSTTPNTNSEPDHNQMNPAVPTKPNDATNINTTQKETPQKPPKPLLSVAQAKEIALKEVKGEVDSVEYKATSDGGHYFIEIELEDDEMDEANVQVHAVTGKILSIQFED